MCRYLVVIIVVILSVWQISLASQSVTEEVNSLKGHKCIDCHTLNNQGQIIKLPSSSLNSVCIKCHNISGHKSGAKPILNKGNLPLDADGTINCATTCHNIHATTSDIAHNRYFLRLPPEKLCFSCHDK
jgi:hypothetical protein